MIFSLCERDNFNVPNGLTEIRTRQEVLYEREEDICPRGLYAEAT